MIATERGRKDVIELLANLEADTPNKNLINTEEQLLNESIANDTDLDLTKSGYEEDYNIDTCGVISYLDQIE